MKVCVKVYALLFALFFVLLALDVGTADAKPPVSRRFTCPASGGVLMGDEVDRRTLCWVNDHDTNKVCIGTVQAITCAGTVSTDGFPYRTGAGLCITENSSGAPATTRFFCRGQTTDVPIGLYEDYR
jgi:hypothetical protein